MKKLVKLISSVLLVMITISNTFLPMIKAEDSNNVVFEESNESVVASDSATDVVYDTYLNPGSFNMSLGKLNFDSVSIDMTKPYQISHGTSEILVEDSRELSEGWSLSVAFSQLTLSRNISGTNETIIIPDNIFSYSVDNVYAVDGERQDDLIINKYSSVGGGIVPLVSLGPGSNGQFKILVNYELYIPSLLSTTSNQIVGLLTGTYNGQITYSLTSGL